MEQNKDLPSHMDRIGGLINPEDYIGTNISLEDFELDLLLDDTLLVRYVDGDSEIVNKGGVLIQQAVTAKTWRIGEVLLAGKSCRYLQNGDFILFPNDKGLPARDIIYGGTKYKEVVFLSEARIFGRLQKKG